MNAKSSSKQLQAVKSKPSREFKENYLTKKGIRLLREGNTPKKEIIAKYSKNRYVDAEDVKVVKFIKHERPSKATHYFYTLRLKSMHDSLRKLFKKDRKAHDELIAKYR